jgi:hypothetical protein
MPGSTACCCTWLGPPVLFALLFIVFQAVFSWAKPFWDGLDGLFSALADWLRGEMPASAPARPPDRWRHCRGRLGDCLPAADPCPVLLHPRDGGDRVLVRAAFHRTA